MASSGKISVELRLVLDKLSQDIRNAGSAMKAGLGKDIGSTAAGTEKAATAMDKLGKSVKETTKAINDQKKAFVDAYKASLPAPKISDTSVRKRASFVIGQMKYKNQPESSGGALATNPLEFLEGKRKRVKALPGEEPPVMFKPIGQKPIAPVVPKVAPKANDEIVRILKSPLAIAAALGSALAGLRVAVGLVSYAFRALLSPLTAIKNASERAANFYAKALRGGGLPLGFTTKRSLLASTIGVSEGEVYQYGNAVRYLNKQLDFSAKIFTETGPSLTSLSWGFKVLGNDIAALVSEITSTYSRDIRKATEAIGGITRDVTNDFMRQMRLIRSYSFAEKYNLDYEGDPKTGQVKLKKKGSSYEDSTNKNLMVLLEEYLKRFTDGAPQVAASSTRLQASAWERMGLVIGTGPGTDYQRETARNTRATAEGIRQLLNVFPRTGTGNGNMNFSMP